MRRLLHTSSEYIAKLVDMAERVKPKRRHLPCKTRASGGDAVAILEAAHRLFEDGARPRQWRRLPPRRGVALRDRLPRLRGPRARCCGRSGTCCSYAPGSTRSIAPDVVPRDPARPDPGASCGSTPATHVPRSFGSPPCSTSSTPPRRWTPTSLRALGQIQRLYANQRLIVESLNEKGALKAGLDVDRATDILWTINHPNM